MHPENLNLAINLLFDTTEDYDFLVLLKILPDVKMKAAMIDAVQVVIKEFKEDAELPLIGFPENYMALLKNNIK